MRPTAAHLGVMVVHGHPAGPPHRRESPVAQCGVHDSYPAGVPGPVDDVHDSGKGGTGGAGTRDPPGLGGDRRRRGSRPDPDPRGDGPSGGDHRSRPGRAERGARAGETDLHPGGQRRLDGGDGSSSPPPVSSPASPAACRCRSSRQERSPAASTCMPRHGGRSRGVRSSSPRRSGRPPAERSPTPTCRSTLGGRQLWPRSGCGIVTTSTRPPACWRRDTRNRPLKRRTGLPRQLRGRGSRSRPSPGWCWRCTAIACEGKIRPASPSGSAPRRPHRRVDLGRDVAQLDVALLGEPGQERERGPLVQLVALHHDPDRLSDRRPGLQSAVQVPDLQGVGERQGSLLRRTTVRRTRPR